DARKKGQIARSRDLNVALASLAATAVLTATGAAGVRRLGIHVADVLEHLDRAATHDMQPGSVAPLLVSGGALRAIIIGPLVMVSAGTGIVAAVAQGGFNFSPQALQFNWQRLSPQNGLSKLSPARAGVDTVKAILTVAVLGVVAWKVGVAAASDA